MKIIIEIIFIIAALSLLTLGTELIYLGFEYNKMDTAMLGYNLILLFIVTLKRYYVPVV